MGAPAIVRARENAEKTLGANGAEGSGIIEHVAIGIARVDGNAAKVAGASTGSASDQGKVARVATSKLGNERVSNSTSARSTMLCSSSARYRCPL